MHRPSQEPLQNPPATCRGRPGRVVPSLFSPRDAVLLPRPPATLRALAPQCASGTGESAKDYWGLAVGRAILLGSEGGVPAFRKGLTLGRAAHGTFSHGSSAVFPGEALACPLQGQSGFVSIEPPLMAQADSSPLPPACWSHFSSSHPMSLVHIQALVRHGLGRKEKRQGCEILCLLIFVLEATKASQDPGR